MKFKKSTFLKTLRASVAELIDEIIIFSSLLSAIFAGLFFNSWLVFFMVITFGVLIATTIHKVIVKKNS